MNRAGGARASSPLSAPPTWVSRGRFWVDIANEDEGREPQQAVCPSPNVYISIVFRGGGHDAPEAAPGISDTSDVILPCSLLGSGSAAVSSPREDDRWELACGIMRGSYHVPIWCRMRVCL